MPKLSKRRVLSDTGYCARELLGFNFDRNEETGAIENKGKGGVYAHGPHQEMVEFLDNPTGKLKRKRQMMCCRKARKTSIVVGWCVRNILKRPNIRIFYSMITLSEARKTVAQVRDALESPKLVQHFGDQKGKPWTDSYFSVAARDDLTARNYTMWAGGLDKKVTGSRADIIILDDLVDWTNVKNPEQIEKAITYLQLCIPLLEAGGILLDVGTPYDEADMHHHIVNELPSEFSFLKLDCGMEMADDGEGGYTLEGEPRFPHLPERQLRSDLVTMGPQNFSANMSLQVMSPDNQIFFRKQFLYGKWELWMNRLSGYILCDTATTEAEYGSYSVIAFVLVGHDDVAYLADINVGLWSPDTFVENLLLMVKAWRPRCRLHHVTMENTAANKVYRSSIEGQARREQIPITLVGIPRGASEQSKRQRIKSLSPRFSSRRFVVLDTVPRHLNVGGRRRAIFIPDGFTDPKTGQKEPAGMVVDQFIRPNAKKKDIPDALADMEAMNQKGERICPPSPAPTWVHHSRAAGQTRQNGSRWAVPQNRGSSWAELAGRGGGKRR